MTPSNKTVSVPVSWIKRLIQLAAIAEQEVRLDQPGITHLLDSLIKAVRQQTYEAIRPEENTEPFNLGNEAFINGGVDYAQGIRNGHNRCLTELDKRYQEVIKKNDTRRQRKL